MGYRKVGDDKLEIDEVTPEVIVPIQYTREALEAKLATVRETLKTYTEGCNEEIIRIEELIKYCEELDIPTSGPTTPPIEEPPVEEPPE